MASLITSGIMNSQSIFFFFISIVLGGMYMANLLLRVNVDKPKDCWKMVRVLKFSPTFFPLKSCVVSSTIMRSHLALSSGLEFLLII